MSTVATLTFSIVIDDWGGDPAELLLEILASQTDDDLYDSITVYEEEEDDEV